MAGALGMATGALAVNNGFETGDLTGWTSDNGNAATSYYAYAPFEGSYLGYVEAGCGAYVSCFLSQTFNLGAGDTISGQVGFQANDYYPFNDYASLVIGGTTVFSSDVATVGDFGASGWTAFSFTAPTAGSYDLTLYVANAIDNGLASGAVLDAVSVASVPEPATWALMLVGFGAVGIAARRRSTASAI